MPTHSQALIQSLIHAPLLVTDLPEARSFDRHSLQLPSPPPDLDPHQKLGHLYEDALTAVLEASPAHELLAHSLQLHDPDQKTRGELDFLLRDLTSGRLIHLELATKFYLALESPDGLLLPGPDARDNYFRKIHRLRTHQLTLTKRYTHLLPQSYRGEPVTPEQLIYGCIFDHVQAGNPATADFIAPTCRRGRWLKLEEVNAHFPPGTKLEHIPKTLWPVPLEFLENFPLEPWQPPATIDRCTMLRVENSPLPHFVTPSGYPVHKA